MKIVRKIVVSLVLLILGCDLPTDPGPMPTTIIDTDYVESLNIMGVLRSDDDSFVYVQRTMTTEEIYTLEADPVIRDAVVEILDRDSRESWGFEPKADSLYVGYYYDTTFIPVEGHTYDLTIRADNLPTLTATTTVPQRPYLNDYTVDNQSGYGSFDLTLTDDTYQYLLYLQFPDKILKKALVGDRNTDELVTFNWDPALGNPIRIMIVGLDENLTRYNESSISFIPNTYHKDGSTVSNGFGCFGSVAVTAIQLDG
ncbi:MAG: DUF4249 family protein [FCB group bacterium]|nr:DUF4249 family protein [FCB group bacterium]